MWKGASPLTRESLKMIHNIAKQNSDMEIVNKNYADAEPEW